MPVKSASQWGLMAMKAHGGGTPGVGPSPEVAREFLEKTPIKKRRMFAKAVANKRGVANQRSPGSSMSQGNPHSDWVSGTHFFADQAGFYDKKHLTGDEFGHDTMHHVGKVKTSSGLHKSSGSLHGGKGGGQRSLSGGHSGGGQHSLHGSKGGKKGDHSIKGNKGKRGESSLHGR